MIKSWKIYIVSFIIFFFSFNSIAYGYESFNNIKAVTQEFLKQNIALNPNETVEIQINKPAAPLQLSTCTKNIETTLPPEANKEQITSVVISCHDDHPWQAYIPVSVQIFTNVIVAKRNIQANQTITEEDVDFTRHDRNRLYSGYFEQKENVAGQIANRMIIAGTILTKNNIQHPILVHKNQLIDLIARTQTVTVTMKGIAKSDGALNDTIQAMNPSSKKILDAVVVGSSKAEVVS